MALVGPNGQAGVRAFLEQWADELAQKQITPFPIGVPYQLNLLMRFYSEANQQGKVLALQERFRRVYLALYEPLLAAREAAEDWPMVITYGDGTVRFVAARQANRTVHTFRAGQCQQSPHPNDPRLRSAW